MDFLDLAIRGVATDAGVISSARGEIGRFAIHPETAADLAAREALLDRAMGPRRRKKSSEKLRRGRMPAEGLAFVARDGEGRLVGTVRLWDVTTKRVISPLAGEMDGSPEGVHAAVRDCQVERGAPPSRPQPDPTLPSTGREAAVLLLGPLAVEPSLKSAGIGSALMRHAVAEARRLGHRAILLVGDASYYARFGFSAGKTAKLAMPGPYERERFLALELVPGALEGAEGVLKPAGRRAAEMKQAA